MKHLTLDNAPGILASVDDEDYIRCSVYNWTLSEGRAVTTVEGKQIKLHRFILPELGKIDHKDSNQLNCCKSNLRSATQSQNMSNRGKTTTNTSGYKGVTWCKTKKKWKAQVMHQYTNISCGYHDTPEAAALAYNDKAKLFHGEFAKLNKVSI